MYLSALRPFEQGSKVVSIVKKLFPAIAAAALLAGCASRLPADKPLYVYVAENGIVTFRGDNMRAKELPDRLKKAGAITDTHIFIVVQGEVPMPFLNEIVQYCGLAGLPNCTIRDRKKVVVEKGTLVSP